MKQNPKSNNVIFDIINLQPYFPAQMCLLWSGEQTIQSFHKILHKCTEGTALVYSRMLLCSEIISEKRTYELVTAASQPAVHHAAAGRCTWVAAALFRWSGNKTAAWLEGEAVTWRSTGSAASPSCVTAFQPSLLRWSFVFVISILRNTHTHTHTQKEREKTQWAVLASLMF